MISIDGVGVFRGLDVGKSAHHVHGLTPAGKKVYDKQLPNSEPRLRAVFDKLTDKFGTVLVVVDQPASIGALPLTGARHACCQVAYLPGLVMRRIADLYPGEVKTDAKDAAVIADAARTMPHTLRSLELTDEITADLGRTRRRCARTWCAGRTWRRSAAPSRGSSGSGCGTRPCRSGPSYWDSARSGRRTRRWTRSASTRTRRWSPGCSSGWARWEFRLLREPNGALRGVPGAARHPVGHAGGGAAARRGERRAPAAAVGRRGVHVLRGERGGCGRGGAQRLQHKRAAAARAARGGPSGRCGGAARGGGSGHRCAARAAHPVRTAVPAAVGVLHGHRSGGPAGPARGVADGRVDHHRLGLDARAVRGGSAARVRRCAESGARRHRAVSGHPAQARGQLRQARTAVPRPLGDVPADHDGRRAGRVRREGRADAGRAEVRRRVGAGVAGPVRGPAG
ncbi:IS110 family transposase [Streptomyces sp. NPDC017230]|uniref:IS110 family transposase n=1 Tax=unclassified Streptomyces TaxID=2593676 RepID=UPI003788CBEF